MKTAIPEPAVSRKALIFSAGIFWAVGGLFVLVRAWLAVATVPSPLWPILIGLVLAILKYWLIFPRVIKANIRRVRELSPHKDKLCLFAFQLLESYLFVVLMVSLGLALRYLSLPAATLATIYFAIGFALMISSSLYFRSAMLLSDGLSEC